MCVKEKGEQEGRERESERGKEREREREISPKRNWDSMFMLIISFTAPAYKRRKIVVSAHDLMMIM